VFILAWSLLGGIMYMGHIWVVEYLCLLSWFNHKKKKKLSFFSQQPLSTLTELGSCTLYNIFCPFQGIIENNFCLSSGLIFCLEISRRVVTLLCLFVQVYETCTSVRSCLLVLSGFTMFRYKALFATQCLNLLLHSWVQYLFCLGI
jgi:hypothetical protein